MREDNGMRRQVADGYDSRLRPPRGQDPDVRTGFSASGKGVKVGATKVAHVVGPKKKAKGKAEGDIVSSDVKFGTDHTLRDLEPS